MRRRHEFRRRLAQPTLGTWSGNNNAGELALILCRLWQRATKRKEQGNMKIYKSAIDDFLTRAEKYYRSGKTLSEMKDMLESNAVSEQAWLDTDRAKIARSNILRNNRLLAIIEVIIKNKYLKEIGGLAITSLACAWDTMDISGIRTFLEAE
jgi:hypothetical protein